MMSPIKTFSGNILRIPTRRAWNRAKVSFINLCLTRPSLKITTTPGTHQINSFHLMLSYMLTTSHNLKVFWSVVCFNTINVVNNFIPTEVST